MPLALCEVGFYARDAKSQSQKAPLEQAQSRGGQMGRVHAQPRRRFARCSEAEGQHRDLVLFNTALDTMLRASDLLPLRVRGDGSHRSRGGGINDPAVENRPRGQVVELSPLTRVALAD